MSRSNIFFLCLNLLCFVSCEKDDPCDPGYKPHESNGQTFCLPDYVGITPKDPKMGNMYYHEKYGIIVYSNGIWKNESNQIIINPDK